MNEETPHFKVVIIGSGFGGTMTGISLADKFKKRAKKRADEGKPAIEEKILMLERGTWWTTPVSTVQDKEVKTFDHLAVKNKQPVQFWTSQNNFRGFIDIFTRCMRRTKDVNIFTRLFRSFRNEDGLFDLTRFGTRGFLGLFGGKSDGITVIRASGVGGGSLIYSNITIQPPDLVFDDDRWCKGWDAATRKTYYNLARHAISYSVVSMLRAKEANRIPLYGKPDETKEILKNAVNTGLSNIVMRTARLDPHWDIKPDPNNVRGIKQIHINTADLPEKQNRLWLDRARVFQTAMKDLTNDFGAVDLAINDLTPENAPYGTDELPTNFPNDGLIDTGKGFGTSSKNYCERQGRCNVGCLPGARHTLNKQLMAAVFGTVREPEPLYGENMEIQALAEVDVISSVQDGGYEVKFIQRDKDDTSKITDRTVKADIVIVAAGCLGTNEIMLRSRESEGALPNLSEKVGFGFSTNGDYLSFLEKTKDRASIVRGPVTTSFGHFNTAEIGTGEDGPSGTTIPNPKLFHTIEDQGVPPAFASVIGEGIPLIRSLSDGNSGEVFLLQAALRYAKKRILQYFREVFTNYRERGQTFKSEEELTSNMMCTVAMGLDGADAQFTLGRSKNESSMRVSKPNGTKFWDDPIFDAIRKSLDRLAEKLSPDINKYKFDNPFLSKVADKAKLKSIALSHPLGGCRMADDASGGVVDEFGRAFDKTKSGEDAVYKGLYIADASIIPTALGVNPSLTISALALRVTDKIIEELPSV